MTRSAMEEDKLGRTECYGRESPFIEGAKSVGESL